MASDQGALDALDRVERNLLKAGVVPAHEIVFGMREVVLDLERVLRAVTTLGLEPDPHDTLQAVRRITADALYGVVPHSSRHLDEVLNLIEGIFDIDDV